jgi:hypothetical protein
MQITYAKKTGDEEYRVSKGLEGRKYYEHIYVYVYVYIYVGCSVALRKNAITSQLD